MYRCKDIKMWITIYVYNVDSFVKLPLNTRETELTTTVTILYIHVYIYIYTLIIMCIYIYIYQIYVVNSY